VSDYDYRRFDDIPVGATFADKFGRMYTKTSGGSATCYEREDGGHFHPIFDTSRDDYYEADEDELEDCDMWDAWPFYQVGE
jgi:hypothetical protein